MFIRKRAKEKNHRMIVIKNFSLMHSKKKTCKKCNICNLAYQNCHRQIVIYLCIKEEFVQREMF